MQSCGYAVPYYTFQGHRTKLLDVNNKAERNDRTAGADLAKAKDGLKAFWALENLKSIDGLDGLSGAHQSQVIPYSVYDKVTKSRRVQIGMYSVEKYWDSSGIKFVAGLSLGLLISTISVRLGRVM